MLFASFSYILMFLPVVVIASVGLRRLFGPRVAQGWILSASVFFYGFSKPSNLFYLAASVLTNWGLARVIEGAEGRRRKHLLVGGLVLNVAYLCVFKYLTFFASLVPFLMPRGFVVPHLPFPLGISFFTITQIMYLVDCYEYTLAAGTLFDHATFVAFFPYVISGPLGRTKRIRHQFGNFGGSEENRGQYMARGLFHFSMGLFKKAVFADSFARVSTFGFASVGHTSAIEAWVFNVAYLMQLYFDFSGYSDMAIGSAMMLGIEIPRNFDAPLTAKSITEFWQRWHISLTNFITTYMYTPLVHRFMKQPALRKRMVLVSAIASVIAMGIAGFWHGAGWTFIVYGLLHGCYLAINNYWRKKQMPKIPVFFSWALTFVAVLIASTYFGSNSLGQGTARVLSMFNPHAAMNMANLARMSVEGVSLKIFGVPMLLGLIAAFAGPSSEERAREFRPTMWNCGYAAVLSLVAMVFVNSSIPTPFVYFRF